MKKITIDHTDIYLEDLSVNAGKIVVSNSWGYNYSYAWGAMGGNIETFIKRINSSYFADKLLGSKSNYTFCAKRTFKNLREFIRNELSLSWYEHMEFQKEMRQYINEFQKSCENENDFVYNFSSFIKNLDFSLISDRWESKRIEEEFNGICEVWHFIGQVHSREYLFIVDLHKKLVKHLSKTNQPR